MEFRTFLPQCEGEIGVNGERVKERDCLLVELVQMILIG